MFPFPFSFFSAAAADVPLELIDNNFAMEFDGTDEYITIQATNTLQITGDLSFSCWFKSSDSAIQFMINLPGGNGTRMWLSSNEVRLSQDVGGAYRQVESGGTYTDGNWHSAIGVMNTTSGFMGIYIDGVLKDSRTDATGTRTTANSDNYIGAQNTTPTYPFKGDLDEVAIWNKALELADVQTIYNATNDNPGKCANLFTAGLGTDLVLWNRMGD